MESKDKLIKLLRENGFNCFPIYEGEKAADSRYKGAQTEPNQEILDKDNYGYIPIKGKGTCIVDFDDKQYEEALKQYASKYMVIDTPHGFHLPVKGLSGNVDKVELFDYKKQEKKIIEIQGPNHYCVGPGSWLSDKYAKPEDDDFLQYHNIGTTEIFDLKDTDFHEFISLVCDKFKVSGKKKGTSTYQHLREKFKEGKPPTSGQSNDYFMCAALVCNTPKKDDGLELSREDALEAIRKIYDLWTITKDYSGRPWQNIEQKINEVYDKDLSVFHGSHKKKKGMNIDDVVETILLDYKLYSDKDTGTIYEEINGFVKIVTKKLKYRVAERFGSDINTTNEIIFQVTAKVKDLPDLDEDIIIFKNGYYKISSHSFHEHDDSHGLAMMGFEDYNFIENPECPMYDKFMVDTFPDEKMRDTAYIAASCCVVPEHQERITMCYGQAGTGKTTYRDILTKVLGEYAKEVDNNGIFNDMFGLADWENKTYISLAEAPKSIKEFDKLKRITGESSLTIRKMHSSPSTVPNYTKIIMDANNLFKIPEDEAGPMFDRLHLLEFTQRFRYTKGDIKKLSSKIAEKEGEHIISMLLMIYDPENEYPTPKQTKDRWEDISIPEKGIFKKMFEYKKDSEGISPMDVKVEMEEGEEIEEVDMAVVRKLAKDAGYQLTNGVYKGLSRKSVEENLEKFS